MEASRRRRETRGGSCCGYEARRRKGPGRRNVGRPRRRAGPRTRPRRPLSGAGEKLAAVHVADTRLGGGKVPAGETSVDLVGERSPDFDEVVCELPRPLEQRPVFAQVREAEIGQARLPRPEQLSAAAPIEGDARGP